MRALRFLGLSIVSIAQFANADISSVNVSDSVGFKQVVALKDWDSVIANDHWIATKVWRAFTAVPYTILWSVLSDRHKRAHIWKTIRDARNERQKIKSVAENLDFIIKMEPALQPYRETIMDRVSEAYPRCGMIAFCQTLQEFGIPMIIATNNDYETLMRKSKKVDAHLAKAQLPPFKFDAAYCAGTNPEIINGKAPNGMSAGSVAAGKDSDEYFEKLFRFAETNFGYNRNDTLFIFTDDKKRNVERACAVAQKEGVSLLGVHRNKSDAMAVAEMREFLKKHAPSVVKSVK